LPGIASLLTVRLVAKKAFSMAYSPSATTAALGMLKFLSIRAVLSNTLGKMVEGMFFIPVAALATVSLALSTIANWQLVIEIAMKMSGNWRLTIW
jgi:hypothetical protein